MDYFPESYVNAAGEAVGKDAITGYKLVIVVYSASW
jgi:hypothetical protein